MAPSESDILAWTEQSLSRRSNHQLQELIDACSITMPAMDDPSRGDRQNREGRSYGWIKAELVKLLTDHRDAIAAARTETTGQTGNNQEIAQYDSVQYLSAGDNWVPALVRAVGSIGGTPFYNISTGLGQPDIMGVPAAKLRKAPAPEDEPSSNRPAIVEGVPELTSGDHVKKQGAADTIGVLVEILDAPAAKPFVVIWDGTFGVREHYTRTELVKYSPPPGASENPPANAGQQPRQRQRQNQNGPRVSSSILEAAGVGQNGVPGEHTQEGQDATQDVPPPTEDASNSTSYNAAWSGMGVSDQQLAAPLSSLDPASLANFRHGSGMLPELAGGAAEGNGRSAIVSISWRKRGGPASQDVHRESARIKPVCEILDDGGADDHHRQGRQGPGEPGRDELGRHSPASARNRLRGVAR
jgi:hypothetical protein